MGIWSRLVLGSDHAGFRLKERIRRLLMEHESCSVEDLGVYTDERSADYPDVAQEVARRVALNAGWGGILICGTGIGMAITANKVPGVRAAVCHNLYTVQMARQHNNANVLCMGGRVLEDIPDDDLLQLLRTWLETPFEGGRHERRVAKIEALERQFLKVRH